MEYLVSRLLAAFLSGVVLSQTGSLIQMGTRNILASPSTLGFDGLSVFWILVFHSLMLVLGYDQPVLMLFLLGVPLFCLVGIFFARFIQRVRSIERLVLIGLTFNLMVGAIFSLWQFLFLAFNLPFPVELWFGHFRYANVEAIIILFLLEILILLGWSFLRKEFQLYSLGKTISRNWNLDEKKLYPFLFIVVSLGTFTIVSLFGAFSFLGLIFPIVARKLWFGKFDLKGEFIIGAGVNGLFLMLIDLVCYSFPIMGAEVPVGLIATAVGAVSLILMLWKPDRGLEILAKKDK